MAKKRAGVKKKASKTSVKRDDSTVRLQRALATAGFGSRRQCEELIQDGRVVIDGETVTELGTKVDPKKSKIEVDGTSVRQPRLVYFALNKPTGIVTTNRDPQGRPRVVDLINEKERVFPVGRLDRNSEGLILLTNDGQLAEQLAHPRYGVKKTYLVTVAGIVDQDTIKQMRQGVHFAEGKFRVDGVRLKRRRGKSSELEIELREGKNREIRRILARLGHKVLQLKRIAIANVRLGSIPIGAYRALTHTELKKLQDEVEIARKATVRKKTVRPKLGTAKSSHPKKPKAKRAASSTVSSPSRKTTSEDIIVNTQRDSSGTVIGAPPSGVTKKTERKPRRPTKKKASARRSKKR